MSDNSEELLNPIVLELLQQMKQVFQQFGIDYFMAGAFARDLHFENREDKTKLRKTNDIDIAVCVNHEEHFHELITALEKTGDFSQSQTKPIKLRHKMGIEVDLIPFGEIENELRETKLSKPKVFVINTPGFAEAAAFAVEIKSGGITLKTCPIEGLIMLKLISWDENNGRVHDLTDIDHIIDAAQDWFSDEIFEIHFDLLEKYDVNDLHFYMKRVTAHVIGREMNKLLKGSPDLKALVISILGKRENPRWAAMKNGLSETTKEEK